MKPLPDSGENMGGIASLADVLAVEQALRLDDSRRMPSSTYEMIMATARRHPDAPALSFFASVEDHTHPQVWNYQALAAGITATANFLHALGVGRDDVVAIVLPNLPQTHLAIWGGQAAGICFPINPMLEPAAIAELLTASAAKVLITSADDTGANLWSRLRPVMSRVGSLEHVALVNMAGDASGGTEAAAREPAGRVAVHDFALGVQSQPTDRLLGGRIIQPGERASYFCTGGTTGAPKIAMRTHANEVANAWSAGQFLGGGISPGKTIFCGLPLFHVNGVLVTGLLPLSRGAHVILGSPQGYRGDGVIKRFWDIVEHHRINFFSAVPTVYAALLQQPTHGRDLSSLEYGLCGAAPMPLELMRTFQEATGLKVLEGYGLTEGTCVSACNPPLGERRTGSIGLRLPLQEMKAVILDDSGAYVRDCAVGEAGTLLISGPNVFAGYCNPAHEKGLWPDLGDGRRWLNTGDLGRQDSDGYFFLTGRKKDLIIRGGHNIDPASIEEPMHRHPAVQFAAAIGRPDPYAGEVPVVYLQLKLGAAATEEELFAFARDEIAERTAQPKAIRIVAAMPTTGVGKIFKPELRRRETEDALRSSLRDAGVDLARLEVVDEPRYGPLVRVTVANGAIAAVAREVLGRFSFRFEVVVCRP